MRFEHYDPIEDMLNKIRSTPTSSTKSYRPQYAEGGLTVKDKFYYTYATYKHPWLTGIKLPFVKRKLENNQKAIESSIISNLTRGLKWDTLRKHLFYGVVDKGQPLFYNCMNKPELSRTAKHAFIKFDNIPGSNLEINSWIKGVLINDYVAAIKNKDTLTKYIYGDDVLYSALDSERKQYIDELFEMVYSAYKEGYYSLNLVQLLSFNSLNFLTKYLAPYDINPNDGMLHFQYTTLITNTSGKLEQISPSCSGQVVQYISSDNTHNEFAKLGKKLELASDAINEYVYDPTKTSGGQDFRHIWYNSDTWKYNEKYFLQFHKGEPSFFYLASLPTDYGFEIKSPNSSSGKRRIWDISDAIPNKYVSAVATIIHLKGREILPILQLKTPIITSFAQLFILCFPCINILVNTSQETIYNIKLSNGFITSVNDDVPIENTTNHQWYVMRVDSLTDTSHYFKQ